MNGKNIEKLVLTNRVIVVSVVLAVLVFTTIPHSSQSTDDTTIDTLFATTDFTPSLTVNVPIAGEDGTLSEQSDEVNSLTEQPDKADKSSETDTSSSDDTSANSTSVTAEQKSYSTPKNVTYGDQHSSGNQTPTTTSNHESNVQSATSNSTKQNSTTSSTIYIDDNYEYVDEPSVSPIPYTPPVVDNSNPDNSTPDEPSADLAL